MSYRAGSGDPLVLGLLKAVQQEMLNLECAKNRPAKNSMYKNSSLSSDVIGHIG